MLVDLIRLTAADGMELDGAYFAPEPGIDPRRRSLTVQSTPCS